MPSTHPLYGTNLATQTNQLIDVQPTDWYYQALQSLTERYGIVYPYKDNTFRPNSKITKAELIDFISNGLIRSHDLLLVALADVKVCRYKGVQKIPFHIPNGINPKDWYYLSYRNLASLIGDKLDYSNGQFQGDLPATRYEMAAILNRAFDGFNELIASQEYSKKTNGSTSLGSYHATFTFDNNQNSFLKNPTILAQVTSIAQFSDVDPKHWAFQDVQSLVERYGATSGYPNGTFRGNSTITRAEFAAQLNAGLDRITELIATATAECNPSSGTQQKGWGTPK